MSYSETITKNDLKNIIEQVSAIDGTDMTQAEIEAFVEGLDVSGINAVDYIIEEGISGDWRWRKWNSGIAESWRNYSGTHSTTSAVLGGYYGTVNFTMPKDSSSNDLFLTEPSVFASGRMGTGVSMVCARDASATSVTVHYLTNQSGSSTVLTRLYAIGRWK